MESPRNLICRVGSALAIWLLLSACTTEAADPVAQVDEPTLQAEVSVGEVADPPSTETERVTAGPTPSPAPLGTRTFSLGFTPFPHAISVEAVDDAYQAIAEHGDLFAFHSTEGVPWVEAGAGLGFDAYGSNLQGKWRRHRAEMDAHAGHEVYLGLTPLDDSRSRLADYWAEEEHLPIPADFAGLAFDAPAVIDAYQRYVLEAVSWYQPDYLAIGLEANLLVSNAPELWPGFVTLMSETYAAVKLEHPNLAVFVTFTAPDLLEGWTDANDQEHRAALDELRPFTDYLALSFYPFASRYLTNPLPDDPFVELVGLANGLPLAIAETGYPAQTTELPSFGLVFDGTADKQDVWIKSVLVAAERYEMPFVVNFVSRDYDDLWRQAGSSDLLAVWRDTGLWDENGEPRPALDTWQQALQEPHN